MKNIIILAIAILITSLASMPLNAAEPQQYSHKPTNGYVPDEETAISIAVAVWQPIYGKEKIQNEKPYKATLKDGVWHVSGSLPKGWIGGTAQAEINKENGCILQIWHEK